MDKETTRLVDDVHTVSPSYKEYVLPSNAPPDFIS